MLAFARRLKELRLRLLDPARTAAIVVTLDQPVVLAETDRLLDALRQARVPTPALLMNRADAGSSLRGPQLIRRGSAAESTGPSACILAPAAHGPLIGTSMLNRFVHEWKLLD